MKTRAVSLTITACMAGIFLTSCGEKSKRDATEVKEDIKELNKDVKEGAKDTAEEIKMVAQKDWETFKTASENTIQNTEKEIKDLRDRIAKANKKEQESLTEDLDKLEQKNKELKERLIDRSKKFRENMVEFNERTEDDEKAFEREFNHDMEELEIALKNMFNDNVN